MYIRLKRVSYLKEPQKQLDLYIRDPLVFGHTSEKEYLKIKQLNLAQIFNFEIQDRTGAGQILGFCASNHHFSNSYRRYQPKLKDVLSRGFSQFYKLFFPLRKERKKNIFLVRPCCSTGILSNTQYIFKIQKNRRRNHIRQNKCIFDRLQVQ